MDKKKTWADLDTKDFPEIAYIEWWDALSDSGWEALGETNIHPVLSIGFVVAEDKTAITIAAAYSIDQKPKVENSNNGLEIYSSTDSIFPGPM
jgi:hypothetical protein